MSSLLEKVECIIEDVETDITSTNTKRDTLTFFPLPEVEFDALNDATVEQLFTSSNPKPIVIRNGCKHFEARSKWKTDDFSYLIEKCGDNHVYVRTETDSSSYRNGQRYKIDKMAFSKYLHQIRDNARKALSSYMAVTNIRYRLNEIIDDVPLCSFENSAMHKGDQVRVFKLFAPNSDFKFKLHSGPHLWIAPATHYEFNHFDPDDSILCMIDGQKKVRMFAPKFLSAMYCNKRGSQGRTCQSQIDFSGCYRDTIIDYEAMKRQVFDKYPLFKTCNVYGYSAVLNPGDILYIPAFWFHQITSLTKSISVNYFCGDYDDENNHYPSRIFATCYESLKFWFLNIIEQNRNYEQFLSVLGNLEASVYNTFYKQWHDFLTAAQVKKLSDEVTEYLMDEDRRSENDIFHKYGDLRNPKNRPQIHRNNPFIKIRGLLYRDDMHKRLTIIPR